MYLMDTCVYLWFLNDDPKLPASLKDVIQKSESLYISIATFWEMAIKSNIGKLTLPAKISEMMNDCKEMRIDILPIAPAHLDYVEKMPNFHGDPFDRLILSQAITEGLTVLSSDGKFDQYGVRTMWK